MQVQGLGWIPGLLSVSLRNVPCFQNRWPPNSSEKLYSLETPGSVKVRGDRVRPGGEGGWGGGLSHSPEGSGWSRPGRGDLSAARSSGILMRLGRVSEL